MKGAETASGECSGRGRSLEWLCAGEPLTWPHRIWFVFTFLVGIAFCYAFPPFQTNDEDSHWLHMWGVAYGDFRCGAPKPDAALGICEPLHMVAVRYVPSRWRWQYMRDASRFVGRDSMTRAEGSACHYHPLPYLVPGLVARLAAFGLSGKLRPGSMLRAAFAARITDWVLVSLAVFLLCRRLPWCRNFALFFYSIPEVLQQGMAIGTDGFLFVSAGILLLLLFEHRPSVGTLVAIAIAVSLMAITKPVYLAFAGLGVPVFERLIARHGWRWRDAIAMLAVLVVPILARAMWSYWQAGPSVAGPATLGLVHDAPPQGQAAYLKAHPFVVFTLLRQQFLNLFGDDLMKGSWLSILGGFGWSAFTMKRWGYHLLLFGCGVALLADMLGPRRPSEVAPRTRREWLASLVAAGSVLVAVVGIIIAMYIYFTGHLPGGVGASEVVGVQGRYYLVPILIWVLLALSAVRAWSPTSARSAGYAAALTTTAMSSCVVANVLALESILGHFYNHS